MGCLAGAWQSDDITDPRLSLKGGSGALLTINGNGNFDMNAAHMKPMTYAQSGLSGSMKFSGQETGHFVVRGQCHGLQHDQSS
jgi:hypothetical protein